MPPSVEQLVERIHASPTRAVFALSGGGSRALSALLEVPGASRTVLEAVVPYCEEAMVRWLGGRPDQFCSAPTARAMGVTAFLRAREYDPAGSQLERVSHPCSVQTAFGTAETRRQRRYREVRHALAGIACTASLASDRPKRGPHRVHLAIQTDSATSTWSLDLQKGRRSRREEEELVTSLVLNATAEACGLIDRLDVELIPGEQIEASKTVAPTAWQDLLLGRTQAIRQGGADQQPESGHSKVLFPGAFNPLHAGHRQMAEVAARLLGRAVEWEISILNPDKPPLDYTEIARRTEQLPQDQAVWLTRAATFEEKSLLFPGATFVVGADTIRRIADPRYYGGEPACQRALSGMAERNCRFLVFGRAAGAGFTALSDLNLPPVLLALCQEVPAADFRHDISSTDLRRAGEW